MTRILGCLMTWFVLAIGIAEAVPARPLYEPPAPAQAPAIAISSLSGTAWLAPIGKSSPIFIFEPDGTLSYKASVASPTVLKGRGSWKVEGDSVYFGYGVKAGAVTFEFRGVIKDAHTIVGERWTAKAGVKYPLTLQRTSLEMK